MDRSVLIKRLMSPQLVLVAGQIVIIDTAANSLPQVRTGTIKAFAVTGRQRLARAPDIPTVGEEGSPGFTP
jgi:tripartite-type tricarboxylate transporter receptor subunit TctC